MATDFPAILSGNLVGIYLWGSLTYEAFDETCSDVNRTGRHRDSYPSVPPPSKTTFTA